MILKDIFAIAVDEPRYKEDLMELNHPIDSIIQQIDIILFTKPGDVLMSPEFGCNLEEYLFETSWNETSIRNVILNQINTYIINPYNYQIDVNVEFYKWDFNVAMLVDIIIDNVKVTSYLV